MTSRRGFLGLLAAAPIAAPMVVKPSERSLTAHGLTVGEYIEIDTRGIPVRIGSLMCVGRVRVEPTAFGEIERLDGLPVRFTDWSDYESPNRLFGASLNDDGDVI